MSDVTRQECAACVASRRSVVDAFFLGLKSGFVMGVNAIADGAGQVNDLERPKFCLAHEVRATEVHAEVARETLQAPYVCPGCYTVGGGPCAPGCIDDEIARDAEDETW